MNKKQILLSILCLLLFLTAEGQNISQKKFQTIQLDADTIVLDTFSLVWGSVSIPSLAASDYTIDHLNGKLIITNPAVKGQTVTVGFRSYPYLFSKKMQNRSISVIEPSLYSLEHPLSEASLTSISGIDEIFSDASLNSYGSLSRGISIGNNQDMVVNSNLNLQLSGKLSKDVEILANITDQNIPIQPEGNSAQLQEFDKVFIQLKYKDMATILAGDIESRSREGYFMKYFKKGQGLQADMNFASVNKKGDSTQYNVYASGSVAKGTYVRQTITAIESNQGPYRLLGENNETYITVLAGSERVYIDEVLLQRGEDNDYIINYNSGEVIFTAKQMITKDKRIVVEFEYIQQDYLRSVVNAGTSIQHKNLNFFFHFYNEQDHKNQTNTLDLTDDQKMMLSLLGDDISHAYVRNMDSTHFQGSEVLYKLTDTTVNGIIYDSIFVYSTSSDSACYRVGFTLVGNNKGNYVLSESVVNGRVYAWVAPVDGVPQGNYEPIRLLSTPQRTQMYSFGMNYQVHPTTLIGVEAALSNNDLNTFSRKDDKDNVGVGIKIQLANQTDLKRKSLQQDASWKMNLNGFYEFKNKTFNYIEDYRSLDFKRMYNVADSMLNRTDHYFGINLDFVHRQNGRIGLYSNAYLIPDKHYMASKNALWANYSRQGFLVALNASLLSHTQEDYHSTYVMHDETIGKNFKYVQVGISNAMEVDLYKTYANRLMPQSFAFNELTFYIKNSDSLKDYHFGLNYKNRIDANSLDSVLTSQAIAHQVSAHFYLLKFSNHQLRFDASYRYLQYQDSIGENTLLTNFDYQARWFKGAVQLGLFYEIGSGMEQKNEYTYLKVVNGQGVYQWIDYNGNGIEELNEFEIAKYADEANYIRLFMASNQYVKTYNNQFSGSLILRPAVVWRKEKGFKNFLSRLSNTTTYRSSYKNTLSTIGGMFNPFYVNSNDTNLVSSASSFRNVFSFNQNSSIWGIDVIYNNTQSKTLTVNGFEAYDVSSCLVSGRVNIKQAFTINGNYENGWNIRNSEYMNKNYKIDYNSLSANLTYQFKTILKISTSYTYKQKNNRRGEELSISNRAGLEINYRIAKRGNLIVKGDYYWIHFRGETNTSVAYEMLESLQPGNNVVVNVNYQTTLWKNLQLNLNYEGRASAGVKMRHLGSVEIRAFF